ncbi:MAG: hypothetical protein A3H98_02710 [Bacteroidetes bacterium RIFCSPLOWO2_02_FULL_36_8]|nr:MAG: hypothetical protein A3H98_02710 [Bacteroidetes bacterium RIFCSPLOWO2_02_FULL_36_8]
MGTERHESRRVDRQLRGRAGRQGDPGTSQFFVCLEDDLMRLFGSDRIARLMDRMGLKEGEVIQHSMVTKSIERAQKKVEENNYAMRKRLLEYDDVMNSQREIVYKRRRNALYGDRLELDICNILYDTCAELVRKYHPENDVENFKMDTIRILSVDLPELKKGLSEMKPDEITQNLYESALATYHRKNKLMAEKSYPIFLDIFKTRGATIENVLVPFSNGHVQIPVVVNLKKAINNKCLELVKSIEKAVTLTIIDDSWKEHLREMDDLKVSVQNAVYEQKDPLLIYKFESFELFKRMIEQVNFSTLRFLCHGFIPVQDSEQVHEAQIPRRRADHLRTTKEEAQSVFKRPEMTNGNQETPQKQEPVRSQKIAGRNDRVSVQYKNGQVKKDVKFKTVEEDFKNNLCVLID